MLIPPAYLRKIFLCPNIQYYLCIISYTAIKDQFHYSRPGMIDGPSLWHFGGGGLNIFSPDGSETLKATAPEEICHNVTGYRGGAMELSCSFYDVVSDGKKYVWAATSRDDSTISVFDIDTGSIVGRHQGCESPHDLEFHPLRDEIWLRCEDTDVNSTDITHLDVLSASNPSGAVQTNILVGDRALEEGLSSSGYTVIHPDLGDVGYITDDSNPKLFQVDLSTKDITDAVELEPKVHGLYEAAFSPVNKHIYVRALVCCSCGTVGSDLESCGRSPGYPVSPTTGNMA